MNPSTLGVISPGFLNQVPTSAGFGFMTTAAPGYSDLTHLQAKPGTTVRKKYLPRGGF